MMRKGPEPKRYFGRGRYQSLKEWRDELGTSYDTLKSFTIRFGDDFGITRFIEYQEARRAAQEAIPDGHPNASSWEKLAWDDDPWAQYAVESHPEGMLLEEIGELMGLTRERVRQIEEAALRKLKRQREVKHWQDYEGGRRETQLGAEEMVGEAG